MEKSTKRDEQVMSKSWTNHEQIMNKSWMSHEQVRMKLILLSHVVFSVCSRMGNAAYIIYIMWSSISGLNTW